MDLQVEKNGYRTSKEKPAVNSELFQKLQMLVDDLNHIGVEVLFWHVKRKFNGEADELTKQALLA